MNTPRIFDNFGDKCEYWENRTCHSLLYIYIDVLKLSFITERSLENSNDLGNLSMRIKSNFYKSRKIFIIEIKIESHSP